MGKSKQNSMVMVSSDSPAQKTATREILSTQYIRRVLAATGPEAIRFQRDLMRDEKADMNLRFKASEAILDRLVGKAAQEVRLGVSETRPLVFNHKLAQLRDEMKAAEDALTTDGEKPSVIDVAGEAAVRHYTDIDGPVI